MSTDGPIAEKAKAHIVTSFEDPNEDSEDLNEDTEGPGDEPKESTEDSGDSTKGPPPRARTPEEIEELQRNPSAGALRFRDGESMEDEDLLDWAIRGSRERSSSSDED
ncbi:MAG: hypothetical protein E5V96_02345 [Mesorhizobium sp.]|nr:MAG: hypothetical protein E5V96_02345 [Mesorhizobium sp.]